MTLLSLTAGSHEAADAVAYPLRALVRLTMAGGRNRCTCSTPPDCPALLLRAMEAMLSVLAVANIGGAVPLLVKIIMAVEARE